MTLKEYLAEHPQQGFAPIPHFNEDGRLIEWFWDDESAFAEPIMHEGRWIGDVYRAQSDRRTVGVSIHVESLSPMMILVPSLPNNPMPGFNPDDYPLVVT